MCVLFFCQFIILHYFWGLSHVYVNSFHFIPHSGKTQQSQTFWKVSPLLESFKKSTRIQFLSSYMCEILDSLFSQWKVKNEMGIGLGVKVCATRASAVAWAESEKKLCKVWQNFWKVRKINILCRVGKRPSTRHLKIKAFSNFPILWSII